MTDALDRHKLAAARLWAATRFPYLASALFASPAVAVPGSGAMAVDTAWRLYVDPDVLAGWSVEQVGSVMVHHAAHLLRDHAARARAQGVDDDEADAWVMAADAETNDDLVDAGLRFPVEPVHPHDFGCDAGKLAEEYFEVLRDSDRSPAEAQCGSGADGLPRDWDRDGGDGVSEYGADLLRRQTAAEIVRHAKEPGSVPASLLRWANAVLSPKVDWRKVLAAEIRRGIADVSGSVDYSYSRPSRRAAVVGDVVLPSLRKPLPEIAIVCDTSASIDEAMLARVLTEVDGVLRGVGIRSNGVRVLACDAAVQTARRVSSARQVELVGGGGTNMGAGIAAAAAARPRPHVIVVLTDGYTPWPAVPPKATRVVVGTLGARAPRPPDWARHVAVDDDAPGR